MNGYKALYKKPQTFFHGVTELPAASSALLTGPSLTVAKPYWRLRHDPQPMSRDDALAGARERVFRAVELRLRADVPVAVRLSGGIDSNVICGVAAKKLGAKTTSFSVIEDDVVVARTWP